MKISVKIADIKRNNNQALSGAIGIVYLAYDGQCTFLDLRY
ncbi:MAG: hypothetical protein Q8N80_02110 [Candidatus Omnitrophota bacterium]|nr:hypothetical protein [Candidatus Omnitrophota bacterium]